MLKVQEADKVNSALTCAQLGQLQKTQIPIDTKTDRNVDKKSELMLMRRATASV